MNPTQQQQEAQKVPVKNEWWAKKSKKAKLTIVASIIVTTMILIAAGYLGANASILFGAKLKRMDHAQVEVTTFAGSGRKGFKDGSLATAQFDAPIGICTDSEGNIYVADANNNRIRKISGGIVTTLAGGSQPGNLNGFGGAAKFTTPMGLTVGFNDTIFVADSGSNTIRAITKEGLVSSLAGSGQAGFEDGPSAIAKFNSPRGIASFGNIVFVTDFNGNRVRKIENGVVTTMAGNGQKGYADGQGPDAMFNSLVGIDVNGTDIVVADGHNHRIRKISNNNQVSTLAGSGGRMVGDGAALNAEFNSPNDVIVDRQGNIIICDMLSNVIRNLTTTGTVFTIAGQPDAGFQDGSGEKSKFDSPSGIAIGKDGSIYIADSLNHRIRRIVVNF